MAGCQPGSAEQVAGGGLDRSAPVIAALTMTVSVKDLLPVTGRAPSQVGIQQAHKGNQQMVSAF